MNEILGGMPRDQRVAAEIPDASRMSEEDLTAHWFRQTDRKQLRFGKKVDYDHDSAHHEFEKHEYLRHRDGPSGYAAMEGTEQGTHSTRFKKGFQRRHVSNIQQDAARKSIELNKETRAVEHLERRRQRLCELNDYNGALCPLSALPPTSLSPP